MKTLFKKIWESWKRFAHRVGRAQTVILITIFYFLIMVPLGALFKLLGWDPLKEKSFNLRATSNWKEVVNKSPDIESLRRQS